jgi:hypothetical protein
MPVALPLENNKMYKTINLDITFLFSHVDIFLPLRLSINSLAEYKTNVFLLSRNFAAELPSGELAG